MNLWLTGYRFLALNPYKLILGCSLLLIAATSELLGLASLLPVATNLFQPGSIHIGIASSLLSKLGLQSPTSLQYLILVAGAMTLRGLSLFVAYSLIAHTSTSVEANGSANLMKNILSARWSFIATIGSGKLLDSITRLPQESALAGPVLAQFLVGSFLCLTFTSAVAYISFPTLLISILIAIPLALCLRWTASNTIKAASTLLPSQEQRSAVAIELFHNAKFFKVGGALTSALQQFNSAVESVRLLNQKVMLSQALMLTAPDTIVAIGVASLIGVVYGFDLDGGSNFLLALMLMYRAFQYTNQTLASSQALARYLPSYGRLIDQINIAHAEAEMLPSVQHGIRFQHSINLKEICFSYLHSRLVLNNFSAEIKQGEVVLLQGESGVGKTTILDILTGILQPTSGSVIIDRQPLTSEFLSSWRQKIAYIPQEPSIFYGTIRSNLVGKDSNIPDSKIFEALLTAQVDDIVRDLPSGLDSLVGERGLSLSGGQRQRLLIARALLSDAEVIVLDEPTSAVDPKREALIFGRIFKELKGKKTLIMAVHRFELDPEIGRTIVIKPPCMKQDL